jgi:hypothetical protein
MTIDAIRAELATFDDQRENGALIGDFTPREIFLVAQLDAWVAEQPKQHDPLADSSVLFGEVK